MIQKNNSNHLVDSIKDINDAGNFDYLVLAIDTDDVTAEEKECEINEFIHCNSIKLKNCELIIIPQTVCMETWFLGNKTIYSRNPKNKSCSKYAKHYDVSKNDPELMLMDKNHSGTNANYHFSYLKSMLSNKNIRYAKNRPREVGKPYYIENLKRRLMENPSSLKTLKKLFDFFECISNHIKNQK